LDLCTIPRHKDVNIKYYTLFNKISKRFKLEKENLQIKPNKKYRVRLKNPIPTFSSARSGVDTI